MSLHGQFQYLLVLLYLALLAAALWLFFSVLLPWVLPFLLALGLAWALERPVGLLIRRFHLRRWVASALCTLALAVLLCGGIGLLLWRAGYELALLLGRLPTFLAGLPQIGLGLERWAYRFVVALPLQFQSIAQDALSQLISHGIALPNRLYDTLAHWAGGWITALPGVVLFLFTATLATYFSSATRPALTAFLLRQIPSKWQSVWAQSGGILRSSLGHWLRAQGLLMAITFCILSVGLLALRVEAPILLAGLIALVDALPIFGTGTVLFPWAALSGMSGNWKEAMCLLALYGVVWLSRSLLEPKLMGARAGLPPLAALFAMYLGFSSLGVPGMILAPLAAIFLKQLHDSGLIRLWK